MSFSLNCTAAYFLDTRALNLLLTERVIVLYVGSFNHKSDYSKFLFWHVL